MPPLPKVPLKNVIKRLANDVVELQYVLDEAFLSEAQHTSIPKTQLRVRTFEVDARVQWSSQQTTQTSLNLSLLNLSGDLRYQRDTSDDSRIMVSVAALPSPTPRPILRNPSSPSSE